MASEYIVSARKYRPKTFDEVIGQEHITTTLKNAIRTGQLAHSFLFTGPRGIGKTSCARILAKTINCTNQTENQEACGTCESCISFQDNNSFAIYELDAASNNGVEHIRELTEQVRFAPQGGKYKVYIIDEVHMLSGAAFNAFLKTLEEPPHYAIFILATTEKHKIIPTILSRCQIFDFKRITSKEIITHLSGICQTEGITYEEDALQLVAQKSEGCMRDALSIMDKVASFSNQQITYTSALENLNILDYDFYFRLIEAIAMQDVSKALLLGEEVLAKGFEPDNIINGLTEHYRNLLVCRDKEMALLLDVTENIKKKFYQQANLLTQSAIINGISVASTAETNLRTARNKRLQLELCLIKLCYLQAAVSIIQEGDNLVKKKLSDASKSIIYQFKAASIQAKKEPELRIQNNETVVEPKRADQEITPKNAFVSAIEIPEVNEVPKKYISPEPFTPNKVGSKLANLRKHKEFQRQKDADEKHLKPEPIELTNENIKEPLQKIFNRFIEEKAFYKNSLEQTEFELNEHRLIIHTPSLTRDLMHEHKMKIKEELDDFFHHSNFELHLTEKKLQDTGKKIKSKREIFEEWAKKNPHLITLRDQLGFSIEP